MKSNEANIFVFIASIIIGLLIALNFNFNKSTSRVVLDSQQYEEAYNQKNNLASDISNLMDKYNELYSKIEVYKSNSKNYIGVLSEIQDELSKSDIVMGNSDVEGQGIQITLKDADFKFTEDLTQQKALSYIVHDIDILLVVNDLRNGGAEAISINGQRIIASTEILCGGNYVYINGEKIPGPFVISAIGKKDVLKNYMMLNDNYLKVLMNRKISVDIKEADDIKIPAYTKKITAKYIKSKN